MPPPEVTSHTLFKDGDVTEKLIAQLRQYVAEHPPNYGDGDCHSILDMATDELLLNYDVEDAFRIKTSPTF